MDYLKKIISQWLRGNTKKIAINISWLSFDKAFHMLIALSLGIWFARYLGPEKFGTFSYALSITSLLALFASLGLNNIVIREIVKTPEKKNELIGSAFISKVLGGVFAYILCIVIINIIEPDDIFIRLLVVILGVQLILLAFEVIELWFKSQVDSKKAVIAKSSSVLLISAVKVYLILTEASLISFAYLTTVGSILTALSLVIIYQIDGEKVIKWKFSLPVVKSLLKDSWPLIFAGMSISVHMKIDQIMVGNILGEKALGNYAVAVKLTETWFFLPIVIVASVYPSMIKYKEYCEILYLKRFQQLYIIMTWIAITIAVPTSFLSSSLINLLFGVQYSEASSVLFLYVWSAVPIFLGVASGSYLMIENYSKVSLYKTVLGAASNVILNLLLIPILGLTGAAISTLISHSIATIYIIFLKSTRQQAIMMLKSFIPWQLFKKEGY